MGAHLHGAGLLCCAQGGCAGAGWGVGAAQRRTEEGFVLRWDAGPCGRLPVLVKGSDRPALPGPLTALERPWPQRLQEEVLEMRLLGPGLTGVSAPAGRLSWFTNSLWRWSSSLTFYY